MIVAGFVLLLAAGVCRVVLVAFSSDGLALSALLWCTAFGLFVWRYAGILWRPRL
ncbi:NnrS protein [compost metagenome]